jgi:hypothetical protein
MAQSTAIPNIAPPSTPLGAPNTVLPFAGHQSRVTIHSYSARGPRRAPRAGAEEATRDCRTSRNRRNSLKIKDSDPAYPRRFSTHNLVRRHADFRPATAPHARASASCSWKRWASAQRKGRDVQPILSRWFTRAKPLACGSRQSTSANSLLPNRAGLKTPALHLNLPKLPCGPWFAGVWTSISRRKADRQTHRLIGTRERLEMNSSPSKSIALALLIGTDLITELHHLGSADYGGREVRVRAARQPRRKIRLPFGGGGPTIRVSSTAKRAGWRCPGAAKGGLP